MKSSQKICPWKLTLALNLFIFIQLKIKKRGGLLRNTLVVMPQGLKILKICIQNWKQAKNQDSGLMLKISPQVGETSEILGFFCSGASSDLKIWLFKQKNMRIFFSVDPKLGIRPSIRNRVLCSGMLLYLHHRHF